MAHRGVWDEINPESSLGAIQNAVDYGFEILELDVRFSAFYSVNSNKQFLDKNGTQREIILQHDKSHIRAYDDNTIVYGLYNYYPTSIPPIFSDQTTRKVGNVNFPVLDFMLPKGQNTTDNKRLSIDDPITNYAPKLLLLNGIASNQNLIHFPPNALMSNYNNDDFSKFVKIVKNYILINLDKLNENSPQDFQQTYNVMNNNSLLNQCIFKAKNLKDFNDVKTLFGDKDIKNLMFTPIFTRFDHSNEVLTNDQRFSNAKKCIESFIQAEKDGKIIFPGVEIVYESLDNDDWLAKLADYVKNDCKKRVIQFSCVLENKRGAWSGNALIYQQIIGNNVNYWDWIFDNPAIDNFGINKRSILPDVFVGDKPLEFRSYLNFLRYNVKPITYK